MKSPGARSYVDSTQRLAGMCLPPRDASCRRRTNRPPELLAMLEHMHADALHERLPVHLGVPVHGLAIDLHHHLDERLRLEGNVVVRASDPVLGLRVNRAELR